MTPRRRQVRDDRTLDLLEWQPPEVVRAFDEDKIRSSSLRGRTARAVAQTLKEAAENRADVARRMSEFLDEPVTEASLNVYASQAREDQTISMIRMVALAYATGDIRPLQAAMEPLDYVLVDRRYLPAVKAAMLRDKARELEEQAEIAERTMRGVRR